MRHARARRGPWFSRRIMLAVTEVNGWALCSYGHARFALDAGITGATPTRRLGPNSSRFAGTRRPAASSARSA